MELPLADPPDEPIQVLVRVRPALPQDTDSAGECPLRIRNGDTVTLTRKDRAVSVRFDAVLDGSVDQPGVYDHVRAAVEAALSGLNSTVMAYGQTGSGKSHSLFGGLNPDDAPPADAADCAPASALEGVASRALRHVFAHAAAQERVGSRVAVSLSLLEVYNEAMHDLLLPVIPAADAPAAPPQPARGGSTFHPPAPVRPSLTLRLDSNKEVFVQGLAEVPLHGAAAALSLVRRALRQRAVRSTDANARSSRSHAVLQLLIETSRAVAGGGGDTRGGAGDARGVDGTVGLACAADGGGGSGGAGDGGAGGTGRGCGECGPGAGVLRSRLCLVDLAGSERSTGAGALLSSEHQREMSKINVSLSALAKCIQALSSKEPKPHIPFRDSTLTRLLQPALSGNSRTVLLATLSPASSSSEETLSTLRFADRAKRVTLRAVKNPADLSETLLQQRQRYEAHIDRLRREVLRLRAELQGGRAPADWNGASSEVHQPPSAPYARVGGSGEGGGTGRVAELESENEHLRRQLKQAAEEVETYKRANRRLEMALENALAGRTDRALSWLRGGADAGTAGGGGARGIGRGGGGRAWQAGSERGEAGGHGVDGCGADGSGGGSAGGGFGGGGFKGVGFGGVAFGGGGYGGPDGSEEDALLQATLAELHEQQSHLDRIRAEEAEIQRLLRAATAPPPPPPPYSRDAWSVVSSPRGTPRADVTRSAQAFVGNAASAPVDPRADARSRWYDPEFDPNSKWYNPNVAARASGAGFDPYAAPATGRRTPRAGSRPNSSRGASPRAKARHLEARAYARDADVAVAQTLLGHAATANGLAQGAVGMGSLYYVLGSQASTRRVQALNSQLNKQMKSTS